MAIKSVRISEINSVRYQDINPTLRFTTSTVVKSHLVYQTREGTIKTTPKNHHTTMFHTSEDIPQLTISFTDNPIPQSSRQTHQDRCKKTLPLNIHTPDSYLYGRLRDGGLGLRELRLSIRFILVKRLRKLQDNHSDEIFQAASFTLND